MAANNGPRNTHGSNAAAAEIAHLTEKVRFVTVENRDATGHLWVRVNARPALAEALADAATAAVASADDNWHVGPGKMILVHASGREMYVALNVLGTVNPTVYSVNGTEFEPF